MINETVSMLSSSVRTIGARVQLYKNGNSTHLATYYHTDRLKSLTIERVGEENKFFGFGMCQKCNVKLIDVNREKNFTTATYIKFRLGTADSKIQVYSYRRGSCSMGP